MAITQAQLTSAITASQLTFNLSNIVGTGLPTVGALALAVGNPLQIDSEMMFVIAQPTAGTVTVRNRGSDGSVAIAHDILANVYTSAAPGDFGNPNATMLVTNDAVQDLVISIGQDSTITVPNTNTVYNINKATAAAITLPAPSLGANGVAILFTSITAAAHVITATGLINDGTSGSPRNTATFAAQKGASIDFVAENGFWHVAGSPQNVTTP